MNISANLLKAQSLQLEEDFLVSFKPAFTMAAIMNNNTNHLRPEWIWMRIG
jgi:hypothetical protein